MGATNTSKEYFESDINFKPCWEGMSLKPRYKDILIYSLLAVGVSVVVGKNCSGATSSAQNTNQNQLETITENHYNNIY